MDKRRAQRRQRVANTVGDLSAAARGRAEAARRWSAATGRSRRHRRRRPTYMTYTLSDTMISG